MARRRGDDAGAVEDLILSCVGGRVSSQTSQRAIRALCRHYGGTRPYVREGNAEMRGVLADAVGDAAAEHIMGRIVALYGGTQVYFPRDAFRMTIALEIYERLGKDGTTMSDLAREYGISDSHGYRLWREGRKEKLHRTMPYLPFLELGESNNRD